METRSGLDCADTAADAAARASFERETLAIAALSHPNICVTQQQGIAWRDLKPANIQARDDHSDGAGSGEKVRVSNPGLTWIYAATFLAVSSVDGSSSVEGRRLTL